MAKAKVQFMCSKQDDKLVLSQPEVYRAYVKGLKDGDYAITINKPAKPKTIPQLGYYYAVILPTVFDEMLSQGNDTITVVINDELFNFPLTKRNIDTYLLKPKCARVREGHHIDKSDMTIDEAMMFIDNCIRWAAEYLGCVIPDPDPNWKFKQQGQVA